MTWDADDSTLYSFYVQNQNHTAAVVIQYGEIMIRSINRDLSLISERGKQNFVTFRASKTQAAHSLIREMVFYQRLYSKILSDSLESLGMKMSNDLSWNEHIVCHLGFFVDLVRTLVLKITSYIQTIE